MKLSTKKGKKLVKRVDREGRGWYNKRAVPEGGLRGPWKLNNKDNSVWGDPNTKDSEILLKKKDTLRSKRAEPRGSRNKPDRERARALDYTKHQRVWSWLRMNAGGVHNTFKSNGSAKKLAFLYFSGGRVSNAWATCLTEGNNVWKRTLIPHNA